MNVNQNPEIKILNWKKIESDGPLKAMADIQVEPGWIFRGIRVSQHPGRRPYIKMSDIPVRDQNTGSMEYIQQVFFPPDIWVLIEKTIVERFDKEKNLYGTNNSETN